MALLVSSQRSERSRMRNPARVRRCSAIVTVGRCAPMSIASTSWVSGRVTYTPSVPTLPQRSASSQKRMSSRT